MKKDRPINRGTDATHKKAYPVVYLALATILQYAPLLHAQPQSSMPGVQTMTTKPPQPVYRNSINLDSGFYVVRLAYSPDGRYLAIGDAASSNIVIWDLKEKREQSRIHVRSNARMPGNQLHWEPGEEIHWSPDGRYLTNGVGRPTPLWDDNFVKKIELWDPMTGKVAHELPAISVNGTVRFNRNGSKLLVHSGQVPDKYRFTIYDTRTWQGSNFDTSGVVIEDLAWTAEDKVFAIGSVSLPGHADLQLHDGRVITHGSEVVQVIDPTGKQLPDAEFLLDRNKLGRTSYQCEAVIPDFANHRMVILGKDGSAMLFDTSTMKILNAIKNLPVNGHWGRGLSPDGGYLFLLSNEQKEEATSMILNVQTGQQVGSFTSKKTWGLAVSPDGKILAVGHESEVLLYNLQ